MASNPPKPLRRGQRPYVDLDPADSLLIRQTYEKLTALFHKVHHLGVEVSQLRAEQTKLRTVVLTLLHDPQTLQDVEAIQRALRIDTYKKE